MEYRKTQWINDFLNKENIHFGELKTFKRPPDNPKELSTEFMEKVRRVKEKVTEQTNDPEIIQVIFAHVQKLEETYAKK